MKKPKQTLSMPKTVSNLKATTGPVFAAQQSAEKALKAFLMASSRKRPSHVHDLTKLYDEAKNELTLPLDVSENLGELSSYYTLARYPNAGLTRPSVGISKTQAERAIITAGKTLENIKKCLQTL